MKQDVYRSFLRRLRRHVAHPERFNDEKREQVVALVCVLFGSPDPWTVIEAARIAIVMEATNLRLARSERTGAKRWMRSHLEVRRF